MAFFIAPSSSFFSTLCHRTNPTSFSRTNIAAHPLVQVSSYTRYGLWLRVVSHLLPAEWCYQISRALTSSSEQIRRMPPIHDKPTTDRYDYVVIGGGSGGSGTSVSNSSALIVHSSLWMSYAFYGTCCRVSACIAILLLAPCSKLWQKGCRCWSNPISGWYLCECWYVYVYHLYAWELIKLSSCVLYEQVCAEESEFTNKPLVPTDTIFGSLLPILLHSTAFLTID